METEPFLGTIIRQVVTFLKGGDYFNLNCEETYTLSAIKVLKVGGGMWKWTGSEKYCC